MADSKLAKWFITAELSALREMLGFGYERLAEYLGVSAATIINWETGKHVPQRSVIKDICGEAGVEKSRTEFLLFVVDNYKQPGLVANLHTRNVRMVEQGERTAGYIFKFESEYVPGPLQLSGYHNEVLPNGGDGHSEAMRRKTKRGKVLEARGEEPQVQMLIGYNALRHLRHMAQWERQIERLLQADEQPRWELRVIDGLHRGSRGSFDFFKPAGLPEAGPAFVYTESVDQSRYIEDAAVLDWYDQLRSEIWDLGKPIKEIFNDGIQLLA